MGMIKIPENALGRVGMIASLKRLPDENVGKLVLVKEPAGMVSTLVGSEKPVFAWLVIALGEQIHVNGRVSRHLYVPDACLTPVSQVSEEELETLSKQTNDADFDAALADLARAVDADQLTWEDVESGIERAAHLFAINACLQPVATPVALEEIGFRPSKQVPEPLEWALLHNGIELRYSATVDPFDMWHLVGTGNTARTALFDTRLLPAEGKRGEVFLLLLKMYRGLFPQAPCPPELEVAAIYERYLEEHLRLKIGLPRLHVDGQIFRANLKWIEERHGDLLGEGQHVTFVLDDGLLRTSIGGVSYGCPAYGNLVGPCVVRLADLLLIPPHERRGRSISIEQDAFCMLFGRHPVPIVVGLMDEHD